jgi:hypothetical protein
LNILRSLCLGFSFAAATAASTSGAVSDGVSGPLRLESLHGKAVGLGGTPRGAILAFWRADCAPCLLELRAARSYAAAARPARFLFVGLQDAPALATAARKADVPPEMLVHGIGSASVILTAYGGAPPRLPLAIALTPSGSLCARHGGLLGTDQVRVWARDCGATHAGR